MNTRAFTAVEAILIIILLSAIIAVAILTFGENLDEGQSSLLTPSHKLYQNK